MRPTSDPAEIAVAHRPRLAHRGGLDGLRAIAVIAVLFFHGGVDVLSGGFLGVDVFFVLSGFLITSLVVAEVSTTGRVDLGSFWIRRFRRLLPALLFVLIGVALYAAFVAEPSTLGSIRLDSLASLFYVANWRFIVSGSSYFESIAAPSPVQHLWSLAVEEQWYLIWPFVCAAILPRPRGRIVLGTVAIAAAVASAMWMSALTPRVGDPSRAYYGTDTRAQALLVGSALALILWRVTALEVTTISRRSRNLMGVMTVGAMGLILGAFVFVDESQRWMYRGGFAAVAVVTAVLIAGVMVLPPLDRALGISPLRWVGNRSYAIYLWHWPTVLTLSVARLGFGGWPRFVVVVLATLALSEISFRLVEQPIRTGRVRLPHPVRSGAFASGLVAVVLVAATLGATDPPAYSVATGDDPDILEPDPDPAAKTSTSVGESTPNRPPRRVVLVGDSIAFSLQDALGPRLFVQGIAFASYAVPGCGIVTGEPIAADGSIITNCPAVAQRQNDAVTAVEPDLVILYSAWETSDRVVDDVVYREGTADFAAELGRLYDEALQRVQRDGARAVFVLQVPSADGATTERDPDHDRQLERINEIMTQTARRHPGAVSVISIEDVVCPDDPCPNSVDGASYRSVDGSHFEFPDAQPVADALAERIAGLDLDALAVP